jgi:hypothetical protein
MKVGDLVRWIDYCEIQYVGYWMERVGVVVGKGLSGESLAYPKVIFVVATNGEHFELSDKHETLEVINEKKE